MRVQGRRNSWPLSLIHLLATVLNRRKVIVTRIQQFLFPVASSIAHCRLPMILCVDNYFELLRRHHSLKSQKKFGLPLMQCALVKSFSGETGNESGAIARARTKVILVRGSGITPHPRSADSCLKSSGFFQYNPFVTLCVQSKILTYVFPTKITTHLCRWQVGSELGGGRGGGVGEAVI